MGIALKIGQSRSDSSCHVLPVKINHTGVVDNSLFVLDKSGPVYSANLRGRELQGAAVDIKGYTGAIVEKRDSQFDDGRISESFRVVHTFKSLAVWDHSKLPSKDDPWGGRLQELLEVSQQLASL